MTTNSFQFKVGDRLVVDDSLGRVRRGVITDIYALPRESHRYWIRFDGCNYSVGYGTEKTCGGLNGPASSATAYKVSSMEYAI